MKTEISRITKTEVHDGELRDNGSEWEGDTCVIKYSSDPLLLSVCLSPLPLHVKSHGSLAAHDVKELYPPRNINAANFPTIVTLYHREK